MSERLVDRIDASYDTEQGLVGLQRRIKRRRVVRGAASAVAVLAVALAIWQWPGAQVAQLRTEDGSVATLLTAETVLAVAQDRADAVELELARGRGHFEVTRKPTRRYRVRSGAVTVEVLGTAFDVTRREDATEVQVDHGLVRVRWAGGEALLHGGEHGVFPPQPRPKLARAAPTLEANSAAPAANPAQTTAANPAATAATNSAQMLGVDPAAAASPAQTLGASSARTVEATPGQRRTANTGPALEARRARAPGARPSLQADRELDVRRSERASAHEEGARRSRRHYRHRRAQREPATSEVEHAEDGWRALERAGKHREAFEALAEQPVEDLEGLLLAADAARLSGHPREAAGHLDHLVQKYPNSATARLAAFTLGRLQLNELQDPRHAAQSFARAYALDPSGPLAEDALAREAEAYRKAGNRARAAEVATRYLAEFPHGSRRTEMSSYLDP